MSNIYFLRDPDPIAEHNSFNMFNALMQAQLGGGNSMDALGSMKLAFPPPKAQPCANNQPSVHQYCEKPGTRACSGCKLVSYCSKECQRANWQDHKPDCKHKMCSPQWKPEPVDDESEWKINPFTEDGCLWGRLPAFDFLNLDNNEKNIKKDYALAFAGSGDLRHVVATVNSLPESYTGKLTILLNEDDPLITPRNLNILLLLTRISDPALSIDAALHFWYSAFLPSEYRLQFVGVMSSFLKERSSGNGLTNPFTTKLTNRSSASFFVGQLTWNGCRLFLRDPPVYSAQDGFSDVQRNLPRKRYRDLNYYSMRPSHRVAVWQYSSYGLGLPHGAMNAHFNRANPSLFKPSGEWLQTDLANMLAGWDIDEMVEVGAKHGASSEDIYGCFYFLLTEKLKTFAERLRRLRISFVFTDFDYEKVPDLIKSGKLGKIGIPKNFKFDRIHLSNVVEERIQKCPSVVTAWTSLLSQSPSATILCDFVTWATENSVSSKHENEFTQAFQRLTQEKKIAMPETEHMSNTMNIISKFIDVFPTRGLSDIHSYCNTSKAFEAYLDEHKFSDILKKLGLQLRQQNRIIPHRIHGSVGASTDSLPVFVGEDSWYLNTKLTGYAWTERFVEIVRSNTSAP